MKLAIIVSAIAVVVFFSGSSIGLGFDDDEDKTHCESGMRECGAGGVNCRCLTEEESQAKIKEHNTPGKSKFVTCGTSSDCESPCSDYSSPSLCVSGACVCHGACKSVDAGETTSDGNCNLYNQFIIHLKIPTMKRANLRDNSAASNRRLRKSGRIQNGQEESISVPGDDNIPTRLASNENVDQPSCSNSDNSGKHHSINESESIEPSLDCLPDEILIQILEELNLFDRFLAELVCKRWQRLAKNRSWTKFHRFSYKVLDEIATDEQAIRCPLTQEFFNMAKDPERDQSFFITHDWLSRLLDRCGAYLVEMNLNQLELLTYCTTTELGERLFTTYEPEPHPMQFLTRLRHLTIPSLSYSSLYDNLEDEIPFHQLLSVVLAGMADVNKFKAFIEKCQLLEALQMKVHSFLPGVEFSVFENIRYPPTLKMISVDYENRHTSAMLSALLSQNLSIQSLSFGRTNNLERIGKFKNLRHLSLKNFVGDHSLAVEVLKSLPNLCALELEFLWTYGSQLLAGIVQNCRQISHLGLRLTFSYFHSTIMASPNENLVPNLPNLTSLSITFNKEIPVSADHIFNKFFECIVSNGKLQYFHTSTALSNYLVNKMLLNCRVSFFKLCQEVIKRDGTLNFCTLGGMLHASLVFRLICF
ncbi:f-box-like domain-containing protein [Ditylenchus destructor]|uniref:F-box-like domain-containing protein n=1 Tax=Ditylenchus destructor TaxID=166010 RepID=A0AAD4NEI4_9BILA|nr:f-box-like domain-containing protein [Ditylenchus destructor]